jgi:hypothetical protein
MSKFLKRNNERKGEKKNEELESKLIQDNLSGLKEEPVEFPGGEDFEAGQNTKMCSGNSGSTRKQYFC